MSRALIYSVLCLSFAVGACSRDRGNIEPQAADAGDREQVEVTGCLASNPNTNAFVLTANQTALTQLTNRAAAGEAESFHYQLVGGSDLQQHVGREVVVKGSIEGDGKDVNLKTTETRSGEPSSRNEQVTPAVESTQEIEMQVERLNVTSVTPTGAACQIG
jgi:hypothetical protein